MKNRGPNQRIAILPGRWVAVCLLVFLVQTGVGPPLLLADDPPPGEAFCRPWTVEGLLMVDIEVVTLFTPEVRDTLGSGFTSTVATRLTLRETGSERVVAGNRFTREIRFDVWDETYLVTTHSDQGTGRTLAGTLDEVEDFCRRISEFRFCGLGRLESDKAYYIALDILLVPISQEQLEQTKRWVEESGEEDEGGSQRGGLGIFFGSMMNVFIGRSTGVDEDRFAFVTEPFRLADVQRVEEVAGDE
jgi:hypothetical protein